MTTNQQDAFAESIANYVATHHNYDRMDKHTCAKEAIRVLFNDVDAGKGFLNALGVYQDYMDRYIDQYTGDGAA